MEESVELPDVRTLQRRLPCQKQRLPSIALYIFGLDGAGKFGKQAEASLSRIVTSWLGSDKLPFEIGENSPGGL